MLFIFLSLSSNNLCRKQEMFCEFNTVRFFDSVFVISLYYDITNNIVKL